ncbi:MAG: Trk family potassium uptake protein [Lachnospiraceae bacterium]|nr:Trk family potassium uptake protein [Lachnospiraceae bacterium]
MKKIKAPGKGLSSFQIIIGGFAAVILLGALLLMLPIASREGVVTPFNQTLFTATSACCVTGLVLLDTASHWSWFGQIIIITLIQIGGLGVISVASFMMMVSGKKISLMTRQTAQNAISAPHIGGIVKLTRFIFITTFSVEILGGLAMLPVFIKEFGARGIWKSFFHSVSAFCNAGFDLMGDKSGKFSSLTYFSDNGYITFVICFLLVFGGIGFLTWEDLFFKRFKFKEYKMQSKVILITSLVLFIIPAVLYFIFDFKDFPLKERICVSIFQSLTPRTAGFNTADLAAMTGPGKVVMMILMLIGGAPGSTAGGMKVTTVAVLFANAKAVFSRRKSAHFFERRIEDSTIKNAATILFLYMFMAITGALVISMIEGLPLEACFFETMSAAGTAGLTVGITSGLSLASQIILIVLMFFGRVGGLTLIYAAFVPKELYESKYPVENITVG